MISKVLVGLDGSPLGERALPYAEALARTASATVCLVQVVPLSEERERLQEENPRLLPYMVAVPGDPPATEKVEERAARHGATRYVDAIATRLGAAGVATEAAVVRGEPAAALAAEATQRRADLVLLSTHGRSGLGRWVFGSVAEGVLAHSAVPVLLVRAVAGSPPRLPGPTAPIVVPLDGSPLAEWAIPVAAALARALSAEIRLARLVPAPAAGSEATGRSLPDEVVAEESAAREYVGAQMSRLRQDGLAVRGTVGLDDPAPGIVAVAEEGEAALIAMATHGRTGVARTLLGSVALEVLHRGTFPVLFVPVRGATVA